jgi:hypothetical protein
MAITRQQSKKLNAAPSPSSATTAKVKPSHGIDFIDASKEWRKNKIKYDNCTFEYIWI